MMRAFRSLMSPSELGAKNSWCSAVADISSPSSRWVTESIDWHSPLTRSTNKLADSPTWRIQSIPTTSGSTWWVMAKFVVSSPTTAANIDFQPHRAFITSPECLRLWYWQSVLAHVQNMDLTARWVFGVSPLNVQQSAATSAQELLEKLWFSKTSVLTLLCIAKKLLARTACFSSCARKCGGSTRPHGTLPYGARVYLAELCRVTSGHSMPNKAPSVQRQNNRYFFSTMEHGHTLRSSTDVYSRSTAKSATLSSTSWCSLRRART